MTQDLDSQIKTGVQVLRNGGTLIYPTETVWAIGCDATNEDAVQKVIQMKHRGEKSGFVVLFADDGMLQRYIKEVPEIAWELIDCADSPLTLILPGGKQLALSAMGTDGSVAVRVCGHPDIQKLIYRFGKPIVSTSANLTGVVPPKAFKAIDNVLIDAADGVISNNSFPSTRKPSAIIKLGLGGQIEIIRK